MTTTTTAEPACGIDALLDAIHALVDPIITMYRVQAPQGVAPPYAVLSVISGRPGYIFGGSSIEFVTLQIAQYYPWAGETAQALADHLAIKEALDLQPLTDCGIVLSRLAGPRIRIEQPRMLHLSQDWEFQYHFAAGA